MNSEPQRDIEKALLAYKQRRGEQLGAPLELHPATRKLLQGEAARTASRPLLTSEEAAKNFVRSFVMSHQQPGFFARHQRRFLWGGALFACLALVLAVLRNDPQQAARERAFTDQLPTPPQVADAQATPSPAAGAANQPKVESERLARSQQTVPPAGHPAVANPRPATVAPAPVLTLPREAQDRRSGAAFTPGPAVSAPASTERGASAPPPRVVARSEGALSRMATADAARKLAEKSEAGEPGQPAKALPATQATRALSEAAARPGGEEVKLRLNDELKRAQAATVAGVAGSAGIPPAAPVAASGPQRLGAFALDEAAQVRQRFQQLDQRAGYRQNLNSPPVPKIMQDFAFERTGNRVRIVDADGSAYEGTVLPAPVEEARAKGARELDVAKVRKDTAGAPAADTQASYRFQVSGVNRKLNQSVEFRGEWRSVAPPPPAAPALPAASLGGVRSEAKTAEKLEKVSTTNALSLNAAPAQTLRFQPSQKELPPGHISGRAVVGGKHEFDLSAVPK